MQNWTDAHYTVLLSEAKKIQFCGEIAKWRRTVEIENAAKQSNNFLVETSTRIQAKCWSAHATFLGKEGIPPILS